jgi:hypothetical protein
MAIASVAAVSALLGAARAERAEAAVAYSGSPAAQMASPGATGISVSIVAADIPVDVAFSHFVVAYDSSLLKATGATCGSALAGTFALVITSKPGIADIGCSKLPPATIYNGGTQTVATVTFDALGAGGTSNLTITAVDLLDERQACIEGHDGSRCTAPGSADALGSITLAGAAASTATPAAGAATNAASTATPPASGFTPAVAIGTPTAVNTVAGDARQPSPPSPSRPGGDVAAAPGRARGAGGFPVSGQGAVRADHTARRGGLAAALAAIALLGAGCVLWSARRDRSRDGRT